MRSAEAWRAARAASGVTAGGNVMGKRPWWVKGGEGKNAETLRHMFSLGANGAGIERVSQELNEQQALGRVWSQASVGKMLHDERMAGIVGRDLWSAVQTQLRARRTCGRMSKDKVTNLFTRMIFAPDGTPMQLQTMANHEPTLIRCGARDG